MAQDWREKLLSDDPKVRAQAVKQLALSGEEQNLLYLKEIIENDPDPRLREYAKKGARHLYEISQSSEPKEDPIPPADPDPIPAERKKLAEETRTETAEKIISNQDIEKSEQMVQRAFSMYTADRTQRAIQLFSQALELNPELNKNAFARSVAAELTGKTPDEGLRILTDPDERKNLMITIKGKGKKSKQSPDSPSGIPDRDHPEKETSSRTLVQNWLSFFQMTADFFKAEEGKANHEDTFVSVLVSTIAAVILFLITGTVQFRQISQVLAQEIPEFGLNMGILFLIFLVGTVILTPLSFYTNAGLQFLGVRLLGGVGDFRTQAYFMGLIQVPMTILSAVISLLSFVPVIGFIAGLGGFVLSIYTLIVTVRAVKVAHNVTTGRAIGGMLAVPLALSIIGGCIMVIFGSALIGMVSQLG